MHKVPLLILPPWINKFYILDMQPKNSMVRFLVEQGFTVFVVSWKNPDTEMDGTTIEDYMDLGILEASDVIREITGSPTLNVMGYCIGGTLLAMTLAWLAAKEDKRFDSATFMVSLQDFSKVGDTAVFLGEPAIDFVEQQMMERGYLDSREMSNMFNLLRSNDLIWSNVVNNYLLGQKPPAFDLLYWNSDGTRMTRAAHSWYLRNTYGENNLIEPGKIRLKGEALDLRPDHARCLRGGCGEGSYRAMGVRLAADAADRRQGSFYPRIQWAYRRDHQSAGWQGKILGERGPRLRPPRRSNGRLRVRRQDGSWWVDWAQLAGRPVRAKGRTARGWAAMRIRCWATRRDVTCWRNDCCVQRSHLPVTACFKGGMSGSRQVNRTRT